MVRVGLHLLWYTYVVVSKHHAVNCRALQGQDFYSRGAQVHNVAAASHYGGGAQEEVCMWLSLVKPCNTNIA